MLRVRPIRSEAVYKRLDVGELLIEALDGDDKYAVSLAWSRVESYAEAAGRLQRSMWRRPVGPPAWPPKRTGLSALFSNVHFYLICWNVIRKHLELLRDVPRFPMMGKVLRGANANLFQRYTDARDHLEHLDERLPGRPQNRRMRVPNVFSGLHNTVFTYGGETVDVGPKSLARLRGIVRAAQDALRADAWARLQATKPERARFVFERRARDLSTHATTRAVNRLFRRPKGTTANAGRPT